MVFFSLFVIGAVILGAGAMLAPAWPSQAPRIGLSSTLLLGIISGGAVWWAELFGWDTLIIDYLLFAIVSGVILGGTLSRGGENSEGGWPSRRDLAFFALVALICMMPLFVLRLPLREHAAEDALISLAVREDGGFRDLAPFYPYDRGLLLPAFPALAAYLSQQLHQDIPTIHMALGALIAFLCVWTVFDFGTEIRDKRLGYSMALVLLASFGMLDLLWQSYYSQLMAVLFAFAFITYALRYYRQHKWIDMLVAGLMLGAILYCSPILFAICLSSYYGLIFFMALPFRQASKHIAQWTTYSRLGLWFGILAVCLFGTGVWILKSWNELSYTYHIAGAYFFDDVSLTDDSRSWLAALYTLSASIAGGFVLRRLTATIQPNVFLLAGFAFLGTVGAGFYLDAAVQEPVMENDMAAIRWIAENISEDELILNYAHYTEWLFVDDTTFLSSHWISVLAERRTVFTGFSCEAASCFNEPDFSRFWLDPIRYMNELPWDFKYIVVPDGLDFPREVDGLRLVFEQGGARVYEVIAEE